MPSVASPLARRAGRPPRRPNCSLRRGRPGARCRGRGRGVLLIARLADLYLARLRRAAWDPRDPSLDVSLLRKQTTMLVGTLFGRY